MAINGIFTEDGTPIPINPVNGHNFKQIRINDNAGTNLLKTVNNEHGFGEVVSSVPNVSSISLGQGDFVFGSLFAHNHSDSIKRPINDSLPGTLKSDLLLYVSPKNDQNLNSFLLFSVAHQIASSFRAEFKSAIYFGICVPIWMLQRCSNAFKGCLGNARKTSIDFSYELTINYYIIIF